MGSDPQKVAAAVKDLATLPDLESVLLLGRDVTDAAAEVYLFGSDPIRAWTAARWHSTHALAEAIMRQYLNCRF